MGLFDLFKNILKTINNDYQCSKNVSKDYSDFEHLTPDNNLPWGWITHNKEFTEKIGNEFSYFLNKWIDAKKKSPKELYSALKSFIMYMEDVQKLCREKGECFEFWFNNILIAPGYLEKRKEELQHLTENFDEIQFNHDHKKTWLSGLDNEIIKQLQANDGILQADFVRMFDDCIQSEVSSKLYFMAKAGELERIKSGRSYILHYKK